MNKRQKSELWSGQLIVLLFSHLFLYWKIIYTMMAFPTNRRAIRTVGKTTSVKWKKAKINGKFTSSHRNFRLLIRHFAVHVSSKHMAQWTLYPDWLIDRSLLNSLPMFPRSDNHLIETNVNEDICIFFWWLYYSRDLYEIILFEVDIWSLWLIYFFVFLKSNSIFWNYRKVGSIYFGLIF